MRRGFLHFSQRMRIERASFSLPNLPKTDVKTRLIPTILPKTDVKTRLIPPFSQRRTLRRAEASLLRWEDGVYQEVSLRWEDGVYQEVYMGYT